MNAIETYWYNESFPLLNYRDVTMLTIHALVSYGVTTLLAVRLVDGFRREARGGTRFEPGRFGWKIALFYYCCGIPWSFPQPREFYTTWALTGEPIYVLLLFNIFRSALWFLSTLPLLLGMEKRREAYLLIPSRLFTATALIVPSAFIPGIVRFAHFIELGFSMTIVGLFLMRLFLRERPEEVIGAVP